MRSKIIRCFVTFLSPLLIAACLPSHALAAFVLSVNQVGPDIVITGNGSINLAALTFVRSDTNTLSAQTADGTNGSLIYNGATINASNTYAGFIGPSRLGSGFGSPPIITAATSSTGDFIGLATSVATMSGYRLLVPANYVSGTPLSDRATYANTNLAAIGFRVGTSTYNWGSGATADSLTIIAAPEPSTWVLFGLGTASLGLLHWHRRRNQSA